MEVLAKGQLSYMILSCLSERDMYGLELIEEIKSRYGVEVKLPSLYSNINRMKELKYIYSYLKESTKGPKCSYSSITELGRVEYLKLKDEFEALPKPEEPKQAPTEPKPQPNYFEEKISEAKAPTTPIEEEDEDEDYNDFFNLDGESEPQQEEMKEVEQEPILKEETTENIEEPEKIEEPEEQEEIEEPEDVPTPPILEEEKPIEEPMSPQFEVNILQKEDSGDVPLVAISESEEEAKQHNQKVFEAAKDFSRNKNKRSYSENQIELALSTAPARSDDEQTQNLSELKQALISSRQSHYEAEVPQVKEEPETKVTFISQEVKEDDGRFITDRVSENDIPKPRKIEPARLNVSVPTYDKSLPAPRRNVAVDPTVSDVKAKLESLYAKAETKKEPPKAEFNGTTETYEDLKAYYASQDVDFKVYERPAKRPKHNTNLLKLYVSMFLFALVGVGSGIMYMIFSLCKLTSASTNFVYYLFPIIALVYVVYCFYNYKTSVSRVPNKLWHPAIVWSIFALLIVAIFLINYACGVPFNKASTYFSTILVPIFASACATVGLYYSTLFALKKFWK